MKTLMILLAMLPLLPQAGASPTDSDGHVLIKQWKSYSRAVSSDLPATQLEILSDIRNEALEKGLAWDYYDACTRFCDVSIGRNWKLRDSLRAALDVEAAVFPAPIVRFYHGLNGGMAADALRPLIDRDGMEAAANRGFYANSSFLDQPDIAGYLKGAVEDDYEYSLWGMYLCRKDSVARSLLAEKVSPNKAALLELMETPEDSLEVFAAKYAGRPVSVIAGKRLLWKKFHELNSRGGSPDEYKGIRAECEALEVKRKSFSGDDAAMLSGLDGIKSLIERLDSKELSAVLIDGRMSVLFRNTPSARVTISDDSGKNKVFDRTVSDPVGSYYVQDTLEFDLPPFDDGQYKVTVKNGDTEFVMPYEKMTISLSVRRTSGSSFAAFAAEYDSGSPVNRCDLILERDGKVVQKAADFRFNGFTSLPEPMASAAAGGKCILRCEYRDKLGILHKSGSVYMYGGYVREPLEKPSRRAVLLTDCTAFHPGDTVHFKAVVFDDDGDGSCSVAPEGEKLTAVLRDTEGKVLKTADLAAGEFGSAAGSLVLDGSGRNGIYTLEIRDRAEALAVRYLRVEEFTLPSFEILFERENRRKYYCGDSVRFEGTIRSYSGHGLSSATVEAVVTHGSEEVGSSFNLSPDGRFTLDFPTDPSLTWACYTAVVKLVDETGETLEESETVYLSDDIDLYAEVLNEVRGQVSLAAGAGRWGDCQLVSGGRAEVRIQTGVHPCMKMRYSLTSGGKVLAEGEAAPLEELSLGLGANGSLCRLDIRAELDRPGMEKITDSTSIYILNIAGGADVTVPEEVENVFLPDEGGKAGVLFGSGAAPVWVVADLTDENGRLLASDIVGLEKGEFHNLRYPLQNNYGRTVTLNMMYFRNGRQYTWSHQYRNDALEPSLPLEFVTFRDLAAPGSRNVFRIKSDPGVECAAAVFDKSLEEISPNRWDKVAPRERYVQTAYYMTESGSNSMASSPVLYRTCNSAPALSKASNLSADYYDSEVAVEEAAGLPEEDVPYVRKDFSTAVAFEPFLHSDSGGYMDFEFSNSDKLSTFVVQLFAHDKRMANSALRREMVVSIPVKLALAEPGLLYEGDRYVVRVSLTSNQSQDVSGRFTARIYSGAAMEGNEPFSCHTEVVDVAGGSSAAVKIPVDVPQCDALGLYMQFEPDGGGAGDAMFVTVPVRKKDQVLTEAHSEVLLAGADRDAAVSRLRGAFVNADASDAAVQEISILDMVRESIPQTVDTTARDLVSLSGALVASAVARNLDGRPLSGLGRIEASILKCRNTDGGFAWFEGMDSSPFLTAVLLQRLYGLKSRGLEEAAPQIFKAVPEAVRYLDASYFSDREMPFWRGGVSLEQYLLVRAMFGEFPLRRNAADNKAWRAFRKEARAYLVPKGARGLNEEVLEKVRRLMTLTLLAAVPEQGFDPGAGGGRALLKSRDADMASLKQYAVEHSGGGMYFPNAVMPFRGLMENELAAHSLICDLFHRSGDSEAESIADGVRIWLMLQKETQQWGNAPAFVEAVASVLDGTPAALGTKVLCMKKTYPVPDSGVSASGNGFTLERRFIRDGKVLAVGDTLHVGDRIDAEYQIWNGENRSFVRLNAPRPACMRPVEQLSGLYGFAFSGGYRDVRADRTEYWYEAFPEEKTTVRESLYVTQEGIFHIPVAEIECLYAPHYRANASSAAPFVAK